MTNHTDTDETRTDETRTDETRTDETTEGTSDATTDGGVVEPAEHVFGLPSWVSAIAPIVVLALVVGGFLIAPPLAGLQGGGEALPDATIDYTTLPNGETIVVHVTNNGPPIEVTQLHVDDANWHFSMSSSGVDRVLQTGESGTVTIPYDWMAGYDYHVTLLTSDGVTFGTTIVAAQPTPGLTYEVLETLTIVGFLVGIVPVTLGMFWFPFLQTMRRKWLHAVLAFSAGILVFLAFDAGFEAFELAGQVPGFYEGSILVVLGITGSFLVVQAAMDYTSGDDGEPSRLAVAYSAATGIGLHNLAEGLAIGSAFAIGRADLGAFLIVGFMLHNVTEGPVFVAPLAEGERPALRHFAALGLIAGGPAILGGWIGILTQSPTLSVLFLAIGVGALVQVVFDITDMISRKGTVRAASNLSAFGVGLAVMYATGLLITV